MRRLLFPLALAVLLLLGTLLIWLWWTDYLLVDDCADAGGTWNAEARVCELSAGPLRRVTVSPHR